MLSSIFLTTLLAISGVSARMENHRRSTAPASYAEGYLEKYDVYHTRYMALGCNSKHDTDFFETCCHPLLATQSLSKDRPAKCTPKSSTTSSAAAATPTADDDDEYEDCEEGEDDCVCEDDEDTMTMTTTTKKAATTSTKKAVATPKAATTTKKATTTPAGSSKTGHATFFYQGGNAGACGTKHSDNDYVVAIYSSIYGKSGSTSQYCGKKVKITRTDTGKTVTATVADECPSCTSVNSLDLSVGAFLQIATKAEGQVPISWVWV